MTTKNVFFIDSKVADYQTLLPGLPYESKWYLLGANTDGVGQMASILNGYSGLDSIQIISHGAPGTLYLGSTILNGSNLYTYQEQLADIGHALSKSGDVLIYGCDIAKDDAGSTFIDNISSITNADIAASINKTGADYLNGDSILEYRTSDDISAMHLMFNQYNWLLYVANNLYGTDASEPLACAGIINVIHGGGGNDTINGGAGNDTLFGMGVGTYANMIDNDVIRGNEGDDVILGETGNDTLDGGPGYDQLSGGGDNDSITGGLDGIGDWLNGENGDDTLSGWLGNDTMLGGDGHDHIWGWGGFDLIYGGDGNDDIRGEGNLNGDNGNDNITAEGNRDTVDGGSGDDTISGFMGMYLLYGREGNDKITGGPQSDQIYGGADDDFIDGANGEDTLSGGESDDYIIGGYGADYIEGGDGNDTLGGNDGNDTLISSFGRDNAYGGEDDDLFVVFDDGEYDFFDGNSGIDAITGYGSVNDYIVRVIDNITISLSKDTELDILRNIEHVLFYGGDQQAIQNLINREPIFNLIGDSTNDNLIGGSKNDTLAGNAGNDTLEGWDGNDNLNGGAGADNIVGGMGEDTITGGGNSDTLIGGAGADFYYISLGDGDDIIRESYTNPNNPNTVIFYDFSASSITWLKRIDNNLLIAYGASGQLTIENQFGDDAYKVEIFNFNNGMSWNSTDILDKLGTPPVVTSNGGQAIAAIMVNENTKIATTITTSDNEDDHIALSIVGGDDAQAFSVDNASGKLSFIEIPDYESPADFDKDNIYNINISASDDRNTTIQSLAITLNNVNEAPSIVTNRGASLIYIVIDENTKGEAYTFEASDPEKQSLRLMISGADAELFELTSIHAGGASIKFKSPPDSEAPTDFDGDNVYEVIIEASDGLLSSRQIIKIPIRDVLNELSQIHGSTANNVLSGRINNEAIYGYSGNDMMIGFGGYDTLDGGVGIDTLYGGFGGDNYIVDNENDVVVEDDTPKAIPIASDNYYNEYHASISKSGDYIAYSHIDYKYNDKYVTNSYLLDTRTWNTSKIADTNFKYVDTYNPFVSSDGANVIFYSAFDYLNGNPNNYAPSLYAQNLWTSNISVIATPLYITDYENIKPTEDGRYVYYLEYNNIYRYDTKNGETINFAGEFNIYHFKLSLNDDMVVYYTMDGNNNVSLRAINTETNKISTAYTNNVRDYNFDYEVSGDGRYVVFTSNKTDIVFGDKNNRADVFVYDLINQSVILASTSSNDGQSNAHSYNPQISYDGRYVIFSNADASLDPTNHDSANLYVKDLHTGIICAVARFSGIRATVEISRDGRFILYSESASSDVNGLFIIDNPLYYSNDVDTVYSSSNYALPDNVEYLYLTDYDEVNGIGNHLNNVLRGNAASNSLIGLAGNDTLIGGGGNDTLVGGEGNDAYPFLTSTVIITELTNEGIDTVQALLTWTLGANLENLELLGTGPFSANGNGLDNNLTGNAAGNLLNGGSGVDTLVGSTGSDTYVVDSTSDVIQETGVDTSDSVRSWVDWTLGDNLENLVLLGTKNLNGSGNSLNNTLTGNGGNNTLSSSDGNDLLDGASGNDTLTGGSGADTFAFTTPLNANRNVDTITDFFSGEDKLQLSSAIFRELGFSGTPSTDAFFHAGSTAPDADDRILYDQSNGALYYDADGIDGMAAMQFAVLSSLPMLQHNDFIVI